MSRQQIEVHAKGHPVRELGAEDVLSGRVTTAEICDWTMENQHDGRVPLAYSSADPAEVARVQQAYGKERVASAVEAFFSDFARLVVQSGVRRLILAGGETSGAVVSGLSIAAFEIGPEIDPGVPALKVKGANLVLALK